MKFRVSCFWFRCFFHKIRLFFKKDNQDYNTQMIVVSIKIIKELDSLMDTIRDRDKPKRVRLIVGEGVLYSLIQIKDLPIQKWTDVCHGRIVYVSSVCKELPELQEKAEEVVNSSFTKEEQDVFLGKRSEF